MAFTVYSTDFGAPDYSVAGGGRAEPDRSLPRRRAHIEEVLMIRNTDEGKWDRLSAKQLDQQFLNEVIGGLQCSPFEAQALLDTVYKVYGLYFETSGTLRPGQVLFDVLSLENGPATRLANSKQVTVTLTLDAGEHDLEIRKAQGVIGQRRHRVQRLAHEAFQQGGLLTIEDLAYRLLGCGQRTLCRDLKAFRTQGVILPLRSTIHDMGRSISHREIIVKAWLDGKEYSEISRDLHHSIDAVRNYIEKFKRAVALAEEGFDTHAISFLVKLSTPLVQTYYQMYKNLKIQTHRRQELQSFFKKNAPAVPGKSRYDDKALLQL